MKKSLQKADNFGSGINLNSMKKIREQALQNVQTHEGHWLQINPRERRLVKGSTKKEQKAYLLGLKRELHEVERKYLETL
jgi:hypothetical protein